MLGALNRSLGLSFPLSLSLGLGFIICNLGKMVAVLVLGPGKVPVRHKCDIRVVFHSHPERPEEERHPSPNTYSDPGHPHHVSVDLGAQKRAVMGSSYTLLNLTQRLVLCQQSIWP